MNLREQFSEFEEVLEAVQRQADSALRSAAARSGIPFDETFLDNPRAKLLLKAHAKLLDEQSKVKEAHSDWARAIARAVRLGVFKRLVREGRVTLASSAALRGDRAIQAALKWVAMRQHPLGNRVALRNARSGLERGVKDPMTEHELRVARACFDAMRLGGENWAAEAREALIRAHEIPRATSRQAFHKLLRRLEIPSRSPLQVITLR